MAIKIFSPGLDQYGPGGTARVKVLIIGGPGAGKTRWSSFFPQPFYADCESGLSSIADRGTAVRAAKVTTSDDMLDILRLMEMECRQPDHLRKYKTLVIDTVDAFQRKVKEEWLRKNPGSERFSGFDAWGYLDSKMGMLLTRLLNLDMNIIVTVHFDEKTVTEGSGDNAQQRQVLQLQLSGSVKDTIFNDFDLVGWMGTYFEAEKGQRVQKRGLTFQPTYEKPFLKDRLNVTPSWMPVTFSDQDYADMFMAIASKLDDLPETQEFGEVPSTTEAAVVAGGLLEGGALPPVDPKEIPLEQHDKPTLLAMARELAKTGQITDAIKGNTIKSELITMIREAQSKPAPAASEPAATTESAPAEPAKAPESDASTATTEAPAEAASSASVQPAAESPAVTTEKPAEPEAPAQAVAAPPAAVAEPSQPAAEPAAVPSAESVIDTPDAGLVNTTTGEVLNPSPQETHEKAVETATEQLGAQVVSDTPAAEVPSTAAASQAPPGPRPAPASGLSGACEEEGCDVALSGENPDLVKLSYIKFRKRYCNAHYQQHRAA